MTQGAGVGIRVGAEAGPTVSTGAGPSLVPIAADFHEAADTFSMLATPTRVQLLWELARAEFDVTTLAETVGASVQAVSQHLAKLRLAGLVSARADGRRQIYQVDDPHIVALVQQAVDHHADLRQPRG